MNLSEMMKVFSMRNCANPEFSRSFMAAMMMAEIRTDQMKGLQNDAPPVADDQTE